MMRRIDRSDWGVRSDDGVWEAQTSPGRPDWGGDVPVIPAQPTQPVYQPHAPMEVPPDAPTTPPLPEKLPIGDPKQTRGDMRWPAQGVYF
ncbi:MAG: hypothetical protein HUU21_08370 [Polyangiaceae bacterium]|nr:hypothetical protein [Polyangiaceae bacterium]